jgi:hypothetical protein
MSPTPKSTTTRQTTAVDRRRRQRFPIAVAAEYRTQDQQGHVRTRNISSRSILVESDNCLPIGKRIELRIDWPARLDGRCPLRLLIEGKILSRTTRGTVISIIRHEYRLSPRASLDLQKGALSWIILDRSYFCLFTFSPTYMRTPFCAALTSGRASSLLQSPENHLYGLRLRRSAG